MGVARAASTRASRSALGRSLGAAVPREVPHVDHHSAEPRGRQLRRRDRDDAVAVLLPLARPAVVRVLLPRAGPAVLRVVRLPQLAVRELPTTELQVALADGPLDRAGDGDG